MKLLILESPNKVKTVKGFLGSDWEVDASLGHITELANDGERNWGFDITRDAITCRFVPRGDRGASVINKLRAKAAKADAIYLGTDPDREGEAISWHLLEQICGKKPYHRVTYNEVTESAVKAAIANSRKLDNPLVEAQRARQVLDKLMGYELSSIVQKVGAGKSAGRVQSAALHILCERERIITGFKPEAYWTITADYKEGFSASYLGSEASAIASTDEEATVDDAADPSEQEEGSFKRITSESDAAKIVQIAQSSPHKVIEFGGRQATKAPPPALTTSALQQAAGVAYGLPSEKTMEITQSLFEGVSLPDGSTHGAITYHRTDSVTLSEEFCNSVSQWLTQHHPDLAGKASSRKNKAGAQAAHEAIRPVDVKFTPESMKAHLNADQLKVYTLIWQRAVASLCAPAQIDRTRIVIQAGSTFWAATGSVVKFPGYAKLLGGLGGDKELPKLSEGQAVTLSKCSSDRKMTKPLGRFSEPKLVQTLERLGIGRPSTFATIMKILREREYVTIKGKLMIPSSTGMAIDTCLMKVFAAVTDSKFTAKMEGDLDLIADGKKDWQRYIIDFYFNCFAPAIEKQGTAAIAASRKPSQKPCPTCNNPLFILSFTPKYAGDKDHYLRCLQGNGGKGCEGEVYFFNRSAQDWVKKGTVVERPAAVPGKATEFVCQQCSSPLEEFSYVKEGVSKKMLRCSNPAASKDETHKAIGVYFISSKNSWWNFTLQAEPHTSKVDGGNKPAARSQSSKPADKSTSKAKSTKASGKSVAKRKAS